MGYRKPCRGEASQTECCSQERKCTCSKPFWFHPGVVSHTPTIWIPILKLGGARSKPAAWAKQQWQGQGQVWSSDFSWELFSHMEKPTALWLSQMLLGIHPFQVCRYAVAAPRSRGWVTLLGWTSVPCPAELCPLCEPLALRQQQGCAGVGRTRGALEGAGHRHQQWSTKLSPKLSYVQGWEVPVCPQTMLGHSQGCLLLVTSVWPLWNSSSLVVSPFFLISRLLVPHSGMLSVFLYPMGGW